jgi:hypothetical protein
MTIKLRLSSRTCARTHTHTHTHTHTQRERERIDEMTLANMSLGNMIGCQPDLLFIFLNGTGFSGIFS